MINVKGAQGNFFDRASVVNAVNSATRRVLSKFGAFVRTRARTSIRYRKNKVSSPGSPPYSHTGLLKRFLFFSWDASTKSVVIGPVPLNRVVDQNSLHALEYGGRSRAEHSRFVSGKKYGNRTQVIKELKPINVKARPFMGPALAQELPGLPAMWKDQVK